MKKIVVLFFLLVFCFPAYAKEDTNWHNEGMKYLKNNEYVSAINAFSKAMEEGDVLHNQYHRGAAYVLNKESHKGLRDLKAAETAFPCFFWLHYYKYLGHNDLKEYEKSKQDCAMMIKIDPRTNYGYHGLGFIALREKNYVVALENTVKALKISPNAGSYNNLGQIYIGLEEYELAVKSFDKAIVLDSKYNALYYNKAIVLEKMGEKEKAMENYELFLEKADNYDSYQTVMKKDHLVKNARKKIAKLGGK